MKVFRIPAETVAIIFDLDNTLYRNDAYVRRQLESPVRRLAEVRGLDFETMNGKILEYRKAWADTHGGADISLGNVFAAFGVSMEETIQWREELYRPEDFLGPDPALKRTLALLAERFRLGLYTNNPVSVARSTLSVLGTEEFFPVITGLDSFRVSKPSREALLATAEKLGAAADRCVSVGDRYDIDLALPLALGMGGILVDSMDDVYRLPELLAGEPEARHD